MLAVRRRLMRHFAIGAWFGVLFGQSPGLAFGASGGMLAAASRSEAGTLPLLAALGLGIAVAAAAVIAFLQLTSKGRNPLDYPEAEDQAEDGPFEPFHEAVTDYTIPLARIPGVSHPAESEADGEPMLCGVDGEFAGASFRVNGEDLLIGRDASTCQVVFPMEIGEVSRRHCTLRFDEETRTFVLEDLGSSNGTFLDGGERLQPGKRYTLRSGDRFALSGEKHRFEVRT